MNDYWIVGGRIVDGTDADPVEGMAIHIESGRIVALGSAPAGVDVIDASGLTITPGLIDAHVHLGLSSNITASLRHELSVAEIAADIFRNCADTLIEGFTTVRDTGGIDAGLARVVTSGKVPGPRIIQCGPVHCQTGGHGHFPAEWEPTGDWCSHDIPGLRAISLLSDGSCEMRKNVRESFRRGADFLKLCVTGGVMSFRDKLEDTQFTVEEIAVAVQEAAARGTYVTVHAHNNAGVRNAVAAGVKCVEHGSEIDEATAALMFGQGVAHVPTLAVMRVLAADPEAAGLPRSIADRVGVATQGQIDGLLATRAAGVRVGSGSDLIGPNQTGRGNELVLRSQIETPVLALQSATRINAEILGLSDQIGTICVGKIADLVGFANNPLDDPMAFADGNQLALIVQAGQIVKDRFGLTHMIRVGST